ncbi:hypothetical protein [Streptomyces specialis]|uniref:hypothetical protein n=1 Tax=Streptomyces specialis TaxID=498367 RepID=UPI00073E1BF4|nr:hypothetical protein [Streptomyces specialis]
MASDLGINQRATAAPAAASPPATPGGVYVVADPTRRDGERWDMPGRGTVVPTSTAAPRLGTTAPPVPTSAYPEGSGTDNQPRRF